jgi:hypothetical protein
MTIYPGPDGGTIELTRPNGQVVARLQVHGNVVLADSVRFTLAVPGTGAMQFLQFGITSDASFVPPGNQTNFSLHVPYGICPGPNIPDPESAWLVRIHENDLGDAIRVVHHDTAQKVLRFDLDALSSFVVSN